MPREFKLPDVGEGVAEGEIVQWLVSVGDSVSEDQPVVEVETDKALVEIPSPVDGVVAELHAEEGDVVPVGSVLVTFEVEGEAPAPEEGAGAGETVEAAVYNTPDATGLRQEARYFVLAGGAIEIPRAEYHQRLARALRPPADFNAPGPLPGPDQVLQRRTQTS